MGERWATVTVTDSKGQRHSVDVYARSTCDAAHLFVTHARANPKNGLPPWEERRCLRLPPPARFITSEAMRFGDGLLRSVRSGKGRRDFCFRKGRR
jgi:hypothetical protein